MSTLLTKVISFLKRQHAEFFVLVLFPIIVFLPYLYFHPAVIQRFDGAFLQSLAYYLFFGWSFFEAATTLLYLYIGLKAIFFWARRLYLYLHNHFDTSYLDIPEGLGVTVKSIGYIFAVMFIALSFDVIVTHDILRSDGAHVFKSSEYVMDLDYRVYDSYVPFELNTFIDSEFIGRWLVKSYMALSLILSAVFLLLIMFNKRLFRMFMISFLIIPMLSIPIWYAVSAVSPSETYRRNVFSDQPATNIYLKTHYHYIQYQPTVVQFLEKVESQKSDPSAGLYADTAFPSMHVAWGSIAVYFAILLWAPLALIVVPWQILNMIGAVYVLQHFAIDLFLGVGVAFAAIAIVHAVFYLEKKYRTSNRDWYMCLDAVNDDVHIYRDFLALHIQKIKDIIKRYKRG